MRTIKLLTFFTAGALLLSACGGGGSSSGNKTTLSDVAGIWKSETTYEGEEGVDVVYQVIQSDGTQITYDYAGDSYDNYANCYWIDEKPDIIELGDGKFSQTYDEPFVVSMSVSGDTLTITGISPEEIAGEREDLSRYSGNISDLIPDCDDN